MSQGTKNVTSDQANMDQSMLGNKTGGLADAKPQEKEESKDQQVITSAEATKKTKEDVFNEDEEFKVNVLMLDKDIHGKRSTWMKMCVRPKMHIRRLKKNVVNQACVLQHRGPS